jgi:hypothetical protein
VIAMNPTPMTTTTTSASQAPRSFPRMLQPSGRT